MITPIFLCLNKDLVSSHLLRFFSRSQCQNHIFAGARHAATANGKTTKTFLSLPDRWQMTFNVIPVTPDDTPSTAVMSTLKRPKPLAKFVQFI